MYAKQILVLFLCLVSCHLGCCQEYTISGYLSDADSGERLIGANILDLKSGKGTITNTYGFYSLTLESDSVLLSYTYIGYEPVFKSYFLDKDFLANIELGSGFELTEVVVTAEQSEGIEEQTQMSKMDLPVELIKKIPALLGETDVLKALQLLPGVQSGGEGTSGLYVRGGSPDQNLILLDGVPVYNASHLFGFFSVFNADAIKDVSLIKGGFPARYGGRLSSVLDISMKEGNLNEFHGEGSIGIVASKLTLEGPIDKGKTSFIVSARRTYIDILAQPIIQSSFEEDGSTGTTGYYFYDLNAKINHKFSDKDRLYLSFYGGDDQFYYEEAFSSDNYSSKNEARFGWGNITTALRWNHVINKKLFANLTSTFSRYRFNTLAFDETDFMDQDGPESFRIEYDSGIRDYALKLDFDYLPKPSHFIRFGLSGIHHIFNPGLFDFDFQNGGDEPFAIQIKQDEISAQEYAIYAEDDMEILPGLKANIGLHVSLFNVRKEWYTSVQPRLSARYLFPSKWALKASFATMKQYVQLLTNEGIGLPTDLWLPTTDNVRPQDSWQLALGTAKTFSEGMEFSAEVYYKRMDNLLAYKEGSSFFQFNNWEDRITQGAGEAYGLELFLQKKTGKWNGWIGYTLSWSNRTFEDINFGKTYPYRYDRRHDISVVLSYDLSDRIQLAGTWVFGTGNAVTLPNAIYEGTYPRIFNQFSSLSAEYYEERNNFRMANYHRLDLGITFIKKKPKWERKWAIGFYNAYSRKNPFFIYTDEEYNANTGQSERLLKQASIFPIIPYVTYGFKF